MVGPVPPCRGPSFSLGYVEVNVFFPLSSVEKETSFVDVPGDGWGEFSLSCAWVCLFGWGGGGVRNGFWTVLVFSSIFSGLFLSFSLGSFSSVSSGPSFSAV